MPQRPLQICCLATNGLGIIWRWKSSEHVCSCSCCTEPEHKAAHIYQHREGFDGAGGRSQQRDGAGPVFTAICANGPVYTMQDSSVKWGRRRTTQWYHGGRSVAPSAFISLGTERAGPERGGRGRNVRTTGRHFSENLWIKYITYISLIAPVWDWQW